MSIIGIGIDICNIKRIKEINEKHPSFKEKLKYTPKDGNKIENKLAKRWCAIEALAKATRMGIWEIGFQEVDILNDEYGAPYYEISEKLQNKIELFLKSKFKTFLTISDDGEYAIAQAILEKA
jgi:holo-[acyl-carrier protein] synthase